jgi:hypothetical protein
MPQAFAQSFYRGQRMNTCAPMILCNTSADTFQEKMSKLMEGLEFARAYIDDLLIISTGDFSNHLKHLDKVLSHLNASRLKVNANRRFIARTQLECLGYWITQDGVKPLNKKVETINNLAQPKNCTEVGKFIGFFNYYCDMWKKHSEILAPLTELTATKKPCKWSYKQQNAFDTMKQIMARETMLANPNSEIPFEKHTDACAYQLGACISQNGKPIFLLKEVNPCTNLVHHYCMGITIHCPNPQNILKNTSRSTTHCSHQS